MGGVNVYDKHDVDEKNREGMNFFPSYDHDPFLKVKK